MSSDVQRLIFETVGMLAIFLGFGLGGLALLTFMSNRTPRD